MPSRRKEKAQLSLPELLLKVYKKSSPTLNFSELKNQKEALAWVTKMMRMLQENEKAKSNDK